jgi:hypothetical protein
MSKRFFLDLLLLYLFKGSLDLLFLQRIFPIFFSEEPYLRLYGNIEPGLLVIGYVALPFLWLSLRPIIYSEKFQFSRLLITSQFLGLILPAFTLFAQSNRPVSHLILTLLGFYISVLTVLVLPRWKPPLLSSRFAFMFVILNLFIGIYTYAMLVSSGGINRINFDLLKVYETRHEFFENLFPLAGYFVPLVANVLNIFLLIYGLTFKKWTIIFLAFFLEIFLFGMTNFKSYLFLPFAALTMYIGLRFFRFRFISLALFGVIGMNVIVFFLILTNVTDIIFLLAMVRRVFFTPAGLMSLYYDFFSDHPYALLSGSTIGKILSSLGTTLPYDEPPVAMIAWTYWNKDTSPNVAWIAASFADFGIPGILIFGIAVGFFYSFGDAVARSVRTKGVVESISLSTASSFVSSAFFTCLFTHGGLMTLLFLWAFASLEKRFAQKK